MLFADVAATSAAVTATSKRSAKVAAITDLLSHLAPDEIPVAVGMLVGDLRQGRIGVGWATVGSIGDVDGAPEPTLSIGEVDATLTALAGTSGATSQERRRTLLRDLLNRATEPEADLLRRLLIGELRQGALDGVMTDAVAKAANLPLADVRRAAMFHGNLRVAATVALTEGAAGLDRLGIQVGRFLQPMLAASSPDAESALNETGPASIEWKLDGARIQVHRDGTDIRAFTRNGNDVADRLPRVRELAASLPGGALVLDGEAIGLAADDRPRRFQDTMSRFGTEAVPLEEAPGIDLHAFFFDVVHADGEDLVDRPLIERLAILTDVAGRWRIPSLAATDGAADLPAVTEFADDALARGHEGVMVKALDSLYLAGRRGGAWRKVKPVRTLDLVVLAAEWGHGRRTGWLSNLHLGARDPDSGGFVMVGKTFKGLTDELLRWQTERFQQIAVEESGYVVHLRPELVVEIALDGVQASTRYPGGVALRFARVRGYRPDRSPADADTIQAVQAMLLG